MKPNISFDDFLKLDLRKGTVKSVEVIPKSKKLLKLQVNFGSEIGERTILAGIAQADKYGVVNNGQWVDNCLVGQFVIAVVNLEPREMMGITSHGMLLAAKDNDTGLWLMTCGPVADGTEVG